jgi:hypothetical protein
MSTVKIDVPNSDIPVLKKAARELEIDFIATDEVGFIAGTFVCHLFIVDLYQLILLGKISIINTTYTQLSQPVKEFVDKVQTKLDEITKTKDNDK